MTGPTSGPATAPTTAPTTDPATAPASALGRAARYGLLVGPVLSMLDSSIVNVAVPDIAAELHATVDQVQWVVSGYLLALAVSLAATAYLARRYGTLRVYAISMVAFVAASAACALAPGVEVLTATRVLQGLAGAPLVPLALSILLGRHGLGGGSAMPLSAALALFLAPALGPSIGGLVVELGGWRWIFLVNVPIGLLGLLLTRAVPRDVGAPADRSARFDPLGLGLLAAGLVCVLLGATRGASDGWTRVSAWVPAAAGLVLLVLYTRWATRREQPAVDLRMVRHRGSTLALGLQTLCSVISFGTVFVMPIFTQQVQGHSALVTGLALVPQGVVMGLGTYAGQKLSARVPLRVLVATGFGVLTVTSAFLLLLDVTTPLWVTAALLSGRAVAIGFVTTPLLTAMLAPLPERDLADGNTLFNIAQRIGGAVGVSVLGSLIGGATAVALVDSFHTLGVVLAVAAAVGVALAARLPRVVGGAPATPRSAGETGPKELPAVASNR